MVKIINDLPRIKIINILPKFLSFNFIQGGGSFIQQKLLDFYLIKYVYLSFYSFWISRHALRQGYRSVLRYFVLVILCVVLTHKSLIIGDYFYVWKQLRV